RQQPECPVPSPPCSRCAAWRSQVAYTDRILAKKRSPALPNLATAQEQGLDFEASIWNAFFLPKGTPAPIVQKLHEATLAALDTPSVQQRLIEIGVDLVVPERRSPQYLRKFVESEIERWNKVIQAPTSSRSDPRDLGQIFDNLPLSEFRVAGRRFQSQTDLV